MTKTDRREIFDEMNTSHFSIKQGLFDERTPFDRESPVSVKDKHLTRRDREAQIVTLGFVSTYRFRVRITAEDHTGRSKVPDTYRYDDVKHGTHLKPAPIFGLAPAIPEGAKPMTVFAE